MSGPRVTGTATANFQSYIGLHRESHDQLLSSSQELVDGFQLNLVATSLGPKAFEDCSYEVPAP